MQKAEFEARIFISLGIVAIVCALSYSIFAHTPSIIVYLGNTMGIPADDALTAGYIFIALIMASVSLLRMWAGTLLTAQRVMAFSVQVDSLRTAGPYLVVRNPIYLADFIAICAFTVCLPVIGLLMPVLFCIHYVRLIRYEEASLEVRYRDQYDDYAACVPRLIPSFRSLTNLGKALNDVRITKEGVRHNALFVLFVPGFILAAITHQFVDAVVVGLPGLIDWAIVHTKLGIKK